MFIAIAYWSWLPDPLFTNRFSKILLGENEELLAAQIATDGQWRFPLADSVPLKLRTCITLFEDEYFYYHPGFNPVSAFKSLQRNLDAGRVKSGGSTITMQLARMLRHNQPRNYYQKLVEVLLALRIELSYKKSSILNFYCSNAPFGGNVVGVPAAAWRYFGRPPHKLSWAESALLAVLPNSPAMIYPGKNHDKLLQKRNRLLTKLFQKKVLDSDAYHLAMLEPLPQKPFPIPQAGRHLLSRCIREHPDSDIYHTSINLQLQTRADDELNRYVAGMSANQVNNACALIAETESGRVLAYIGNSSSPGNPHENYVDVITAPRSTGSILKPFLYAFMLNDNRLLPTSLVEDVPFQMGSYGPRNMSLEYDGLVHANHAITRSLNVPAIKMLQDYGQAKFHQRLKQLGFATFSKPSAHYGLSIILGGGEATLWDLAGAYASMGRSLKSYSNSRGTYLSNNYRSLSYLANARVNTGGTTQKNDLLSASAIYFTLNAMTELLRPQDFAGWSQFLSKNKVAWKTGTSFGYRDAWAIGLNPKYTVAVWVGNADGEGRPGLTGTSAAAPLMFSLFNLLPATNWFIKPNRDFEKISICRQSGFKASEICNDVLRADAPPGAYKTRPCPYHKQVYLDSSGQYRVNSNCYPVHLMKIEPWFVVSPLQEFYYKQRNPYYKPLPEYLRGCLIETSFRQMEIIYPREGFKIYIPVNEKGIKNQCVFKATHKNARASLYWYLDGEYIGSSEKFHQISALPPKGEHLLEITDNFGESIQCRFELIEK